MSTGLKAGVILPVCMAALLGALPPTAAESGFDPFGLGRTEAESTRKIGKIEYRLPLGAIVVNSNSLLQAKSPSHRAWAPRFLVYVTAYSSSVDETDSTPHVTASGTKTRDGVVASNLFPLGTKVRMPELFGDEILVVEDRMHDRFTDRIDVWMPSKWQALSFGKKQTAVEIVEL